MIDSEGATGSQKARISDPMRSTRATVTSSTSSPSAAAPTTSKPSARMPTVTRAWSAERGSGSAHPAASRARPSETGTSWSRLIAGDPMNAATNVLTGFS